MKNTQSNKTRYTLVISACMMTLSVMTIIGFNVSADSIDYLAMNISPASMFNGMSGNFTVNGEISGGSSITFDLKYQIDTGGSPTTYPKTIDFGASTEIKPVGASDAVVTGLNSHTFTSSSSMFTDSVTIMVPTTPGAYSLKIKPTDGTGGMGGLGGGGGITINFVVKTPDTTGCDNAATTLVLSLENDGCIIVNQPTTELAATLTSGGLPLSGKTVEFSVDGTPVGTDTTDANGVATLIYDSSTLSVGDHTVTASFDGDPCDFNASIDSETLSVGYNFLGFQPPIKPDGSHEFGGRTIPVKIRIVDFYGVPVPDAEAFVFYAPGMPEDPEDVNIEAEPLANTNGDSGNAMRYDPEEGQYIFNWDIAGLENGKYTIRVDLGEGSCSDSHTVVVTLNKKGSK
jgi:hypothetical protein